MILSLDFVAQRYGILPSKLLSEGSSIDMIIADAAQGYQNKLQAKHNANGGLPQPPTELTVEEMQAMIDRVKSNH